MLIDITQLSGIQMTPHLNTLALSSLTSILYNTQTKITEVGCKEAEIVMRLWLVLVWSDAGTTAELSWGCGMLWWCCNSCTML